MTGGGLSRRELLRRAGVGAGALGLGVGGLLAACARDDEEPSFGDEPAGLLNFANRPSGIDRVPGENGHATRPSLDLFTARTGIQVNYREVIPGADAFFRQIEPFLAADRPTGWDLIVITSGQVLFAMIELGYLEELPNGRRPSFDRYAAQLVRDPAYDPDNGHTMAWQSGIMGIAYDPFRTGRSISSVEDLFADEFAGRVGMFDDVVDTPSTALLALGVPPAESTESDWAAAAELLRGQREGGIAAGYYQQEYVALLGRGRIALTMARSSDILAAKAAGLIPEQIEFVVPDEGGLLWTDCMCIAKGATHLADAMTFMDFVYEPATAAQITQYVQAISPVPEAQAELVQMAEAATDDAERARILAVAEDPLVFPTPEAVAELHPYRVPASLEEVGAWEDAFRPVLEFASASPATPSPSS
jgi:spermidine/putrescine transport system substrate-binding protein